MRVSPLLLALVMLVLALRPPATLGQAPDWQTHPSAYESTMNITGQLFRDGLPTAQPGDRLAAFVGEELRGTAAPVEVGGQSLFFLTVFANTDGETITFKTYDAHADQVRTVDETLGFQSNAVTGTVASPFRWTAGRLDNGAPAWTINAADYIASMTVTAMLSIDGTPAAPDDLVAAFAGDTLRGVATAVELAGQVIHFLTVYAHAPGDNIAFKVYDASANEVFAVNETLVFATNAFHGSVQSPLPLTASKAGPTAIERLPGALPAAFHLGVNYPNPFNPHTTIPYDLAETVPVHLTIHDTLGRRVATLVEATQPPGRYAVGFEATGLPSGLYLYRLQAGSFSTARPLLLMK